MIIYLDNSATTKVRPEVVEAMLPYLGEQYGNPSSIHGLGAASKEAIKQARAQVAKLFGAASTPEEVYFTACGTMSNNIAILGRARFVEANGLGRHLITSTIEHPSVAGPCRYLESLGWRVTYLPVDRQGFVTAEQVEAALASDTSIISIMWANNEIGTLQPIAEIAELASRRNIFFHTDAVQLPGKISIDVSQVPVSALSVSGHKFFAPKGVGALYLRRGANVMPIAFGGGQEFGLMPGTEALPNIVALGKAAELAYDELSETSSRLREMQRLLLDRLLTVDSVRVTGPEDLERRLPGHVSLVLPDVEGETLVVRADLKGIAISSGSACHSGIIEPSSVLRALRLSDRAAMGAIRVSAGKFNTLEECRGAAEILCQILEKQRASVKAG